MYVYIYIYIYICMYYPRAPRHLLAHLFFLRNFFAFQSPPPPPERDPPPSTLRPHLAAACLSDALSIRQHTSAYFSIRQKTSAYVSIRQHTSAYVSIRQQTSAYVSRRQHRMRVRSVLLFFLRNT